MVKIQKLKRPTKRSGWALRPGGKTKMRGLVIVNTNAHEVYVDKFTTRGRKRK